MTTNVALLGEAGPAPAVQGRAQHPLISAAGVNDMAALARQQLPSAVPAATLIAAYHAAIQQQLKALSRPAPTLQPSAALAAQFMAQEQLTAEEATALFAPHTPPTASPPPAEDDYLRDMRIARGEVAPAPPRTEAKAAPALPATPASEQQLRTALTHAAAGLPALVYLVGKRPLVWSARGISAYQLTQTRNSTLKQPQAEAM